MANVHVDYQELKASANQLKAGQQEVESQLARLKSNIESLVGSGFKTDQASGKFEESYRLWNDGANKVIKGLEGMTSFLNRAVQQHEQLDTQLGQSTTS